MLLTITLESNPETEIDATALSHLLRKHPAKVQSFNLPVGQAHVFYPEVSAQLTTAALLLEVDPIGLVRNRRFRGESGVLDYYVNDRPYAASSLMSVALGKVLRSAMTGMSEMYAELAQAPLPLRLELPVVSARGKQQEDLIQRLFEPLGWSVETRMLPLDPNYEDWGASRYHHLKLEGQIRLDHALRQLYVLLPVLDDSKHYWVNDDETEKLARQGEGWLAQHPERELILQRYLAHQKALVGLAQEQLTVASTELGGESADDLRESPATGQTPLLVHRANTVLSVLKECGAQSVVDVGCGAGALLRRLQQDRFFTRIVGTDVSVRSLQQAARNLQLEERSDSERSRIDLLHSSVLYTDERLRNHDALVLMEVIEHIDLSRLPALENSVFAEASAAVVIVTTPNSEFNELYPRLAAGTMRHEDHRFEWTASSSRRGAPRSLHATATQWRSGG
ncbi:3' terminal RNA ribose 2'-O-methyltransferase Hen1 [Arthrobacter sp. JCM 19049]|uniref:3' terminal RNA ribose 2'-O-methyltransferase Hen1 n=1 Tax=Arthrobacter sp. JCM 19049 TaxID=1460643 RepID=UPI000A905BF1|nr:3' terminal RNA ribose 2'-O-methyltransferase Hen1 [Arthrobacter sp. JCM 19049]